MNDRKRKVVLALSMAATVSAGSLISYNAYAADVEIVASDDPVLNCEGDNVPGGYDCDISVTDVHNSHQIKLALAKVTDDVAGCTPGNQPGRALTLSYSSTGSIQIGGGIALDLYKGVNQIIDKVGPSIGVSVSKSTTFGTSETYTIPADYGKISWGMFSPDAVEAEATIEVHVTEPAQDVPDVGYSYRGENVKVVTPIVKGDSGIPQGTLSKDQRDFSSLAEFRQLCGEAATPPPGLQ